MIDTLADWVDQLRDLLNPPAADTTAAVVGGALAYAAALAVLLGLVARRVRDRRRTRWAAQQAQPTRRSGEAESPPEVGGRSAVSGEQVLIAVAIAFAVAVAVISGVRSFEAVSERFDSDLVPLTADGMIVACTALRLAALLRGWRLPGALATTYAFIFGTVWLNVSAARDWADVVAHALAPLAYAVLVEFLAHFLRLHLGLVESAARRPTGGRGGMAGMAGVAGLARLGWLTWVTSPIVTTRVGLHLARTGTDDPVAARALVQQLIRMLSRLRAVCPSRPGLGWLPFDPASAARMAALRTVRDGLLSAAELAALLPTGHGPNRESDRVSPGALLALVDNAALRCTAPTADGRTATRTATRTTDRTTERTTDCTGASGPVHHTDRTSAPEPDRTSASTQSPSSAPDRTATDRDLVTVLHKHAAEHNDGAPMSQREVMRLLGVGTPKAKRLTVLAGWVEQPGHRAVQPAPDGGGRGLEAEQARQDRQLHVVHPDQPDQSDQAPNQRSETSDDLSHDLSDELSQADEPNDQQTRNSTR